MRILRYWVISLMGLWIGQSAWGADDHAAEIARVEQLGQLIQDYDQSAWHATDRLFEDVGHPSKLDGLRGWITVPDGRDFVTKFIAERGDKPVIVWQARTRKSKVKSSEILDAPAPLTGPELGLWRARQSVIKQGFESCARLPSINTIVFPIPDDPEGNLYVYMFSSSTNADEIVLGLHHRFTVSADGLNVSDQRTFTKSCFVLSTKMPADAPKGAKPIGLTATHLLAPYPEEHHVFANLSRGIDLFITTTQTDDIWKVSKGKITPFNPK